MLKCSRTDETKQIKWHETCKCKHRLDARVCNNKQRWNDDKCKCECKELIDKGVCDKGSIWNPSICKCECNKSCDVGKYLDYEKCKCKKRLVNKLTEHSSVQKCTENIDKTRLVEINVTECKHNSCTLYIVLFSIIYIVNIAISRYFLCFYWYLKNVTCVKLGTGTQWNCIQWSCTQTTI